MSQADATGGSLLDHVPQHWTTQQLKRLAQVTLGKMLQTEDSGDDVWCPYLRAANIQPNGVLRLDDVNKMWFSQSEAVTLTLQAGDVVVVEGGAVGRAAVLSEDLPGWGFQNSINRVRPHDGVDGRFLSYFLNMAREAGYIDAYCNTVSMAHLTAEKLGRIQLSLPASDHQTAIADHLDRETAQIDNLIAKQEQLIDSLRERRLAVVDHRVWEGMAPGAAQSPTSIGAVPTAPAHWCRVRNKNLLRERSGLSAHGAEELLTVSHLTGVTPRSEKTVTMFEAESLDGYRLVEAGDLVINTMWAWMGALGVSRHHGIVSPAYGVYRPVSTTPVDGRYYDYLYRSRPYIAEMTRYSRGIRPSRLRLYPDVFLSLGVLVPPIDEQRAIADHLDEVTAKTDLLISKAQDFVERAKERRAALITAAVTGQTDLRSDSGLGEVA